MSEANLVKGWGPDGFAGGAGERRCSPGYKPTVWVFACALLALAGCQNGCGKTPVPFKRDPAPAQTAEQMKPEPVAQTYADETRSAKLGERDVERTEGSFRASLDWDLGKDGTLDSFAIGTDALSRVNLETWVQPSQPDALPAKRTSLVLTTPGTGCALETAGLAKIAPDLALATVDVACAGDANPTAALDPTAALPPEPEAPGAPPGTEATPDAPPAPEPREAGTLTHHQFVVTAEVAPKLLLHLAVMPPKDDGDPTSLGLVVSSEDRDGDSHGDVLVTVELREAGQAEPSRIPLVWLNRPSGLARDRAEPEQTFAKLAAAFSATATDPLSALPAATQVLDAHRVLCQESGAARLWVDEGLGLACGSSASAGKAAVIRALALAKQQQLLPALQARSQLDASGYKVEAADRERVNTAIAAIRGQTSYVWERGPDVAPPTAPAVRLPVLGFLTEDQLLIRTGVAQSYDLRTRVQTPSAVAQGVVMTDPGGRFAVVDLVRDCAGRYLRVVPSSAVVSGFVASGRGMDAPLVQEQPAAKGCTSGTRRPDRSGFTVLGMTQYGALVAQGSTLQLVPLDADGKSAGAARELGPSEPAGPLGAPGAISQDGLRHALATSEGVAVIDRGPKPGTTLIRSPASCTGRVSDVAISPSGQRIAMVCSGRVYWAHETQVSSVPAPAPSAPSAPSYP